MELLLRRGPNMSNRGKLTLIPRYLILYGVMILTIMDAEARDRGEDIILTKGKLIMRGGKGKGNLILDTGSKESEMPMMRHHFNPFMFYPMHQQHHQPPMIVHPVYFEDHSAMQHYQPEQHKEYHHEQPHYQHHEIEYQHHEQQHHEPHHEQYHQVQHEQNHEHHEEPQHEMHQEQHEPIEHQQYEHEGQQEHEGSNHEQGYGSHPMMSMLMYGSGLQPAHQQMLAMQALHQQNLPSNGYQDKLFHQELQLKGQDQNFQPQHDGRDVINAQQSKQSSTLNQQSSNNPLIKIIKPLFKRNLTKQKKP